MVSRFVAALALAAVLMTPGPARADDVTDGITSIDFGVQCVLAGVTQACASVQIWNEFDTSTGVNWLIVQVQNMEGSPGWEHLTPAGLGAWQLNNLFADPRCWNDPQCDPRNYVITHPDYPRAPTREWSFTGSDNGQWWDVRQTIGDDEAATLFGCSVPEGYLGYYFRSCGEPLTWSIATAANEYGSTFAVTPQTSLILGFDGVGACSTRRGEGFREGFELPRCVKVPEPDSLLLLATGLLGMGVVAIRRKRAGSSDASNQAVGA